MMRYLKILFLSMVIIGLFTGPAISVTLRNSVGDNFGTGATTTNSYRIAYEIYSETAGVSTVADRGRIRIYLDQPLNVGNTANLVMSTPVKADFNSAGGEYKWALRRVSDSALIGITPSAGLITPNLPFSIIANASVGDSLDVIQWGDIDNDNVIDGGEAVVLGAGIYVRPGLGATCGIAPIIKIDFTTPYETTESVNFAYITAQFGGTGPAANTLTAELNTDVDFKQFIYPSGPNVYNLWDIYMGSFISITDGASGNMWIAYALVNPFGSISFDVNTVIGEPGATIWIDDAVCTRNSGSTVFTCSKTSVNLVGNHWLDLEVDGSTINEPTNWMVTNFNMQVTTAGLKNLCISLPPGGIGVWYGGLEAFVPFVKGTENRSYETYIKLFNRYNKDAKLYVSTFADVAGGTALPIMISTGQLAAPLDSIPKGGTITIVDTDIGAFLTAQGISWDMAKGIPVKFSIRVPSQIGTTTSTGSYYGWQDGYTYDWGYYYGWHGGDSSGTIIHQNPNDPFVEGIVISVYPGGGQRSVPLKFKTFKSGEYGH